jgi:hypothetical protein
MIPLVGITMSNVPRAMATDNMCGWTYGELTQPDGQKVSDDKKTTGIAPADSGHC